MAVNAMFMVPRIRRERHFRGIDPLSMNYTDKELRQRYRFGRAGITYLANLVRNDLERLTRKQTALSVEQQLMIALRFFGSGSQLQVVGDTMGVDKSTVSRVICAVTDRLVAKRYNFICWPTQNPRLNQIRAGFYDKAGFPNVIGCVDGTHIKIQAPSQDEPAFVNRKMYHSINVQGVCDHEGRFTNINAMWPGSAHDSHIFRTSAIGKYLQDNYRGIEDGILLGDSGYPCRPFLLTPYRLPVNERKQQRFNNSHMATRSTIERTFGIWKKRFHILRSEIRMDPTKACRIIIACAVLHNIAILLREPEIDDGGEDDNQQPDMPPYQGQQDGRGIRDHFTNNFFG